MTVQGQRLDRGRRRRGRGDRCLHDASPIVDAVAGRRVLAIACTHGHWDHVDARVRRAGRRSTPILMHPPTGPVWDRTHADRQPDGPLDEGALPGGRRRGLVRDPHTGPLRQGASASTTRRVTRCSTALRCSPGGPGSTGDANSVTSADHRRRSASGSCRCLPRPPSTPGHGDSTTVGGNSALGGVGSPVDGER